MKSSERELIERLICSLDTCLDEWEFGRHTAVHSPTKTEVWTCMGFWCCEIYKPEIKLSYVSAWKLYRAVMDGSRRSLAKKFNDHAMKTFAGMG